MRKRRMNKDRLLHTTVALLLLVLAGCSPATPEPLAPPATPESPLVSECPLATIDYIQFRIFDPVYIAIENGYFADHCLEVVLAGDAIAGPNAIQAVAGGYAEAGLSSVPAILNANAAGLPVQGVVDIQSTLDSQALQRWYVLADSPLQTVSDLRGFTPPARYGINIEYSSFHFTTLRMLEAEGIAPTAVDFRLLSFSNQILALLEGEIDVAGLIPPYHGFLEQQAAEAGLEVRELWNDYDLYGENHVSLIFVNRVWAENNPDQATAFVSGVVDAINWIEENPAEAKAIVEKYTEVPAAVISDYHFTENGAINSQYVADWYDWLLVNAYIEADWLDMELVASNRYNTHTQE